MLFHRRGLLWLGSAVHYKTLNNTNENDSATRETDITLTLFPIQFLPNMACCICSGNGGTVGFPFTACFLDTLMASSRPVSI